MADRKRIRRRVNIPRKAGGFTVAGPSEQVARVSPRRYRGCPLIGAMTRSPDS